MSEAAEGVGLWLSSQTGVMETSWRHKSLEDQSSQVKQSWAISRRSGTARRASVASHHHWRTKIKNESKFTLSS